MAATALRADVAANAADQALLKRFGVYGPLGGDRRARPAIRPLVTKIDISMSIAGSGGLPPDLITPFRWR